MSEANVPHKARWRKYAPAGLLAVWIAALHLPYLAPGGPYLADPWPAPMLHDEGTVLYDSYRTALGETMYRDFFEFQGPVLFYTIGAVMRVTGPSMTAARVVFLIVTTLSALLIALIVSRFCSPWVGVAAAAIHATALVPGWPATYAHWFAELFVLGALAILTRRKPPTQCSDITAGALLGLATMTVQSLGVPVLVAVLGVAAGEGAVRRDWQAVGQRPFRIAAGAAVPLAVIVLFFAAHGALDEMYYQTIKWPFANYLPGQLASTQLGEGIAKFAEAHQSLPWAPRTLNTAVVTCNLGFAYLLLAAAAAVAVAFAIALVRGGGGVEYAYCAGAALAALTPLYLGLARRDITHVEFLGGLALCGTLGATALMRRPALLRAVAVATVAVAMLAASNYAYKLVTTVDASRARGSFRDYVFRIPEARFLDERVPPNATIVAQSGYFYFFLRRSASPITLLYEYYTDDQYAWIAEQIVRKKPEAIYVDEFWWRVFVSHQPEIESAYVRQNETLWLRRPGA
jgi:hypothetical protein